MVARWSNVESPNRGPTDYNLQGSGIHHGHYGIGQWDPERGGGPEMLKQTFDQQLDHAIKELNEPSGAQHRARQMLDNAKTAMEAATGASQFERAGGYNRQTGTDAFTARTAAAMAGVIGGTGAAAGQTDPHKPGFDANAVKFHDYYAAPAATDAAWPGGEAWTGGKPSGLYGSPQIQAWLRQYGMGGDIHSKYKTGFFKAGFDNAPITHALTEAGGWASKANSIMEALKLDTRLAVHGLTQDWRDITAYGHNLKEAIKKGLGGPAARERDRIKNQLLSSHAAAKAFDMRSSAADHLKTTPMGAGHTHLMNHSNVHAPSQHNNITIHGVTDPETAMRDLGWHQKRLWSGLTRNTTTTAN
jgi:hypothetical protein